MLNIKESGTRMRSSATYIDASNPITLILLTILTFSCSVILTVNGHSNDYTAVVLFMIVCLFFGKLSKIIFTKNKQAKNNT